MTRTKWIVYCVLLSLASGLVLSGRMSRTRNSPRILGREVQPDGSAAVVLLSEQYRLDQVYKSMRGPRSNHPRIRLSDRIGDDATVWLTGVKTDIVDSHSLQDLSKEFLCHSNLTFNPETTTPEKHNTSFESPKHADWRLFTLVPGRLEIRLPDGFGIPAKNATVFDYFTMALNQNSAKPRRDIRMRTRISYRQESEGERLQPLFRRAIYVYQQHQEKPEDKLPETAVVSGAHQGEECALSCPTDQTGSTPSSFADLPTGGLDQHPGATCCVANASIGGVVTQFGKENTIHWMVPPGSHRFRSEVTEQLSLPFDTTAHYITGHLHPFGKSVRLIDLETGETVFQINSKDFDDRLGVESMSEIVSQDGIPIWKGRRYELVTEYNNTTNAPIDAMAILYFYALDKEQVGDLLKATASLE